MEDQDDPNVSTSLPKWVRFVQLLYSGVGCFGIALGFLALSLGRIFNLVEGTPAYLFGLVGVAVGVVIVIKTWRRTTALEILRHPSWGDLFK